MTLNDASKKEGRAQVLIQLLEGKPHQVGAEIGVQAGDTSFQLAEGLPELKILWCVDAWKYYEDYEHDRVLTDKTGGKWPDQKLLDEARATFYRRLKEFRSRGIIYVLPMFSDKAAQQIKNESLDFVFLDANHSYQYAKWDIVLWLPKVRPGGLVAGHDYNNPHNPRWGVTKAVDEKFNNVFTGSDFTWWIWKT